MEKKCYKYKSLLYRPKIGSLQVATRMPIFKPFFHKILVGFGRGGLSLLQSLVVSMDLWRVFWREYLFPGEQKVAGYKI